MVTMQNKPLESKAVQITELQKQITILHTTRENWVTQIQEWNSALKAIASDSKIPFATGANSVFDILTAELKDIEDKKIRDEKIVSWQNSVNTAKLKIDNIDTEIKAIAINIERLENQVNFEKKYLPYHEKFKHGYTKLQDEYDKKVASAKKDLEQAILQYEVLLKYLEGDKTVRLQNYGIIGHPQDAFKKLETDLIPAYKKQLDNLLNQQVPDLLSLPEYRAYLIARVEVDPFTTELSELYPRVNELLAKLIILHKKYPQALDFDPNFYLKIVVQ